MSTLVVVEEVLRELKKPVSVREIVEFAGDRLPTRSKTPDTVVARDLSMDIKKKGEGSAFVRTSPGRYTMREFVAREVQDHAQTQTHASVPLDEHAAGRDDLPAPMSSVAITEPRAPTRRAPTSDDTVQAVVQEH